MTLNVATITLNPAYDLIGFCPQVALNDVNLVQTLGLYPAGKGINVARVLSDLGINVTVSGFLGKDNADGFTTLFEQNNIQNQFHRVNGQTRINVKVTEKNEDVTDLNFSGFTIIENDWSNFVTKSLDYFSNFDIVSINGSLPQGIKIEAFTDWLSELKKRCPKIVFDSSREVLTAAIPIKPWLIKPNDKELEMWAGKKLTSRDEIISVASSLVEEGIENVVVSLGGDGALWVTETNIWFAEPPVCKVVSTVGAGDSMVAGLMYGVAKGWSIQKTLQFSSAIAALSVSQAEIGVKDKTELDLMLTKINLIKIK